MIPITVDLTLGYSLLAGTHATISTDTTTDSPAIDLQDYDGPVTLMASIGDSGDASTTITISLVECATSGGTYTAITGATTGTIAASATANDHTRYMVTVPNWNKRFVKTRVVTAGGGTPSVPISTSVLARKKIGGTSGVLTTR